ncbi:Abi family protein [Psychromicrobium lacuslunae]|uniref:Abortive phage infection protein n=1 Tax=Psychromicrobium lacuslunae TaxID=1618207 RepID=A0A0D4C3P7_9MICC|nr:Abi family protein [Psychromicrobium lacuslunae]AJT43223.1 abortive phage infection protein [Psychromicrobium lacuslunae]
MVEYTKEWLSIEEQVNKLRSRGVEVTDSAACKRLLLATGYYRLTGYLYPFRKSMVWTDGNGKEVRTILSDYQPGTSVTQVQKLIDFDRKLRLLILDGIERVEVSLRMQIGYILGQRSPYAHLAESTFIAGFTEQILIEDESEEEGSGHTTSKFDQWKAHLRHSQDSSKEEFVKHFTNKYDGNLPIWVLTEIMELGQLGKLYRALQNDLATAIAEAFEVPRKQWMSSWVASLNYVRNVAAHHARLFNRKLVYPPSRPPNNQIPLLAHLRSGEMPKEFGVYSAFAVIAYLLRTIEPGSAWPKRVATLVADFPESAQLSKRSMGFPDNWLQEQLWTVSDDSSV